MSALEAAYGGSGNVSSVLALAEHIEGDTALEVGHLLEVHGRKRQWELKHACTYVYPLELRVNVL